MLNILLNCIPIVGDISLELASEGKDGDGAEECFLKKIAKNYLLSLHDDTFQRRLLRFSVVQIFN